MCPCWRRIGRLRGTGRNAWVPGADWSREERGEGPFDNSIKSRPPEYHSVTLYSHPQSDHHIRSSAIFSPLLLVSRRGLSDYKQTHPPITRSRICLNPSPAVP